jgi:uncharacterized protein
MREVPCPTCGKPVPWSADSPWRPFCSERCKLIDLGAWFAEEHAIPGEQGETPPPGPDDGQTRS